MNEFKCQALEQQSSGRKQGKRKRGNCGKAWCLTWHFNSFCYQQHFAALPGAIVDPGGMAEGRKRELLEQTFQPWSINICMGASKRNTILNKF